MLVLAAAALLLSAPPVPGEAACEKQVAAKAYEDALACYRALTAKGPRHPNGYVGAAQVMMLLGRQEAALAEIEKALKVAPKDAGALNGRGVVMLQLGRPIEAYEAFLQAVESDPYHVQALSNLASLADQPERAAEWWGRVLAVEPANAPALVGMARVEIARGRNPEALAWMAKAAKAHPADGEIAALHGKLLAASDPAAAVPALERATRLAPGLADPWFDLGLALFALDRFAEARRAFESADRLAPREAKVKLELGKTLLMLNEWNDAESKLREAEQLSGTPADRLEVVFHLGSAYRKQGRAAEAEKAWRAVLAANPDHVLALMNLAVLQVGAGRVDEALANLRRALKLAPDMEAVRFNYGAALLVKGDVAGGTRELRAVREMLPTLSPLREPIDALLAEPSRAAELLERTSARPPR